jgi:polysaccharide biosynthesis protein PslH
MKILQLCNKTPYPPVDGGAIAVLNMSRSLANEGNEVHILAMSTTKHPGEVTGIPEELRALIHFHFVPVDTSIRPLMLLFNLIFSRLPYNAVRFDSKRFRETLTQLLKNEIFDIIQLEGLYLKTYLPVIRKYHPKLVVYRAHNIEHRIWQGLTSMPYNFLKKIYLRSLAYRIRKFEYSFMNQYDLLVPISTQDEHELNSMGNTKPVCVIAAGMMPDKFRQLTSELPITSLFFIGALDWIPNQEALSWFIDEVWSMLKSTHPLLSFHVAGRNAPAWLGKKCTAAGVTFHGEVPDSSGFIDAYHIMVVPLFAGSGIRIKIIEGMARSKIVITTRMGAQGLDITDGVNLLLAENSREFISAIENLLNNNPNCREIQKNAYTFALEKYNNDRIISNLIRFYRENSTC